MFFSFHSSLHFTENIRDFPVNHNYCFHRARILNDCQFGNHLVILSLQPAAIRYFHLSAIGWQKLRLDYSN